MSKTEVPNVKWDLLIGDIGFKAAQMAANDPDCKKELEPIRAAKNRVLNELKAEESKIYEKYKQKYREQLYAEKEIQEKLVWVFLNKQKHLHEYNYEHCTVPEKLREIANELENGP